MARADRRTRAKPDAVPAVVVGPAVARRRLGDELRGLREAAGMTLRQSGTALQRSQPTMSRLENGTTIPRAVDVEKLISVYRNEGVEVDDDQRDRMLALVEDGRRPEWFNDYRDVIAGDMTDDNIERFISHETYADRMVNFEPDLVPGLLQTPGYTRAVIDAFLPGYTDHQRTRLSELRTARGRQQRQNGSPRLDLVIGENALWRPFGGPEVLAEQLAVIAGEIRNGTPGIEVRIVPATLALPAAIGGPFVLLTFADTADQPLVYLESRAGDSFRSDPATVADYEDRFASLVASAYDDEQALRRIEEVTKQIG